MQIDCPVCQKSIVVPQPPRAAASAVTSAAAPRVIKKSRTLQNILLVVAAVFVLAALVIGGWYGYSKFKFHKLPEGLVALWSGEGNANDSVGGNNGQLVGSVGFMPGKVGQAFNFNNAMVQISASPALDVGKGNGFTFECWIKPVSVTQQMLIAEYEKAIGTYDWADVGFNFGIHASSELVYNLVDDTANHSAHEIITPPNLLVANVWQHIALTYDKASGIAVIYINGAVAVQSNLGSFTPQTGFPYLLIGARTTFGSASNLQDVFSGGVDEIGIYNHALSASEIQAIYEGQK